MYDISANLLCSFTHGARSWMRRLDTMKLGRTLPQDKYEFDDHGISSIVAAGTKGWRTVHFDSTAQVGSRTLTLYSNTPLRSRSCPCQDGGPDRHRAHSQIVSRSPLAGLTFYSEAHLIPVCSRANISGLLAYWCHRSTYSLVDTDHFLPSPKLNGTFTFLC